MSLARDPRDNTKCAVSLQRVGLVLMDMKRYGSDGLLWQGNEYCEMAERGSHFDRLKNGRVL